MAEQTVTGMVKPKTLQAVDVIKQIKEATKIRVLAMDETSRRNKDKNKKMRKAR